MGASIVRFPSSPEKPAAVSPWPLVAVGAFVPPPEHDLVDQLASIAERLDRLLMLLSAGAAPGTGTVPIGPAARPTVDEAELAEILRQEPRTLRQKLWEERLPPSEKFGRKRLWDRAEIARWVAGGMPNREQWVRQGRR
ncbi:MAG: helix-turn-helix domain-containing protein [Pirellulales bacterium]